MDKGWIKLHRKILDCEIWVDDSEKFDKRSAWIDLLLLANHRDKQIIFDNKPMTVERGQYVTSVRKLSARWGWGNQKTLKFLKLLEDLMMITKESDNRRTLITITNYEVYQGCDNTDGTLIDTLIDTQSERKQKRKSTTNKNIEEVIKNEKNEKNNIRQIFYPNDSLLDEAFAEYVQMRKKLHKPFATDHAIELAMKKLERLSGGDNDKAIQILNQSIENSWQGLFELKGTSSSDFMERWKNI